VTELVEVRVPDIGDFADVPVIEVLVEAGEAIEPEHPLITLESDKATMDVPAPQAGVVRELLVGVGDTVSEGTPILRLEATGADAGEGEGGAEPAGEPRVEQRADAGSGGAEPEPPGDGRGASAPAGRAGAAAAGYGSGAPAAPPAPPREAAAPAAAPPGDDTIPGDADVRAQLVVLGGGPGGYTAAFRAADLGLETVLIERHERLGGVCLNVGCIPSKALLHIARVVADVEDAAGHGLRYGKPEIDVEALRAWKDGVVGKLVGGLDSLASQRKVRVVRGAARFGGGNLLRVEGPEGESTTVGFAQCIIAAGSRAVRLPGVPAEDPRVMDSTRALELEEVPERLLVVGGGIIGLELATVYDALGSRVTVVELLDQLITGCDPDLVRPLHRRISRRYEAIHLSTRVAAVDPEETGLRVTFEGESAPGPAEFDRVLVAVGRRPNGGELGAEQAGVRVDDRGFIPVDDRLRTNVPHVFAIGDVAGEPLLAHKAMHEGRVAAEVAAGQSVAFDARAIPSVAYTDPEVAWMGLTETVAKAEGIAYEKASIPWSASGRALGLGRPEGLTKLLLDPESRRLLGAGIVGLNAGDVLAETVHALEMGADMEDIGLSIHSHPTLSETVGMAADAAEGTVTDLYMPRRERAPG
jgi:dihydrolipoamide dehydrogenase